MRGRWYPGTRRRLRELMRAQERDVLTALDTAAKALTVEEVRQLILAYISDWKEAANSTLDPWVTEIIKDGEKAGKARILSVIENLSAIEREGFARPVVIPLDYDTISRQVIRSEIVNEETARQVLGQVQTDILERRTLVQMRQNMRKLFRDMRSYRVDRITNTVVVGAFESGTLSAWQQAGLVTGKSWVSGYDERVRGSHDVREHPELQNVIPLEQSFVVGGSPLLFPGDPNGPASLIINCRCTMAPHVV